MSKFKHGEIALSTRFTVERDEENTILKLKHFSSTMNPSELKSAFLEMARVMNTFLQIQSNVDRYDKKANKYLKAKYGKDWWTEVFKSFKTLKQTENEICDIWKRMPKRRKSKEEVK